MAFSEIRRSSSRAAGSFCAPLRSAFLLAGAIALLPLTAPARTWVVNQQHARAADKNAGTEARPLKTIGAAAERAQPGDTILVRAGVYRERVAPPRGGEEGKPILYQGAPGEAVYVRGSEQWRPAWQPVADRPGVFTGRLEPAMFGAFNPFLLDVNLTNAQGSPRRQSLRTVRPAAEGAGTLQQTRGQVFVDGAPLVQAGSFEQVCRTPGSWLVNAAGDAITIHFPPDPAGRTPAQRLVELTARSRIFGSVVRGLGYIHVKGFIFEHAANNHPTPQVGAVSLRSGHHWLLEDNTIRYATTIGLEAGMEWGIGYTDEDAPVPYDYVPHANVIRNNRITDNGLCGIAATGHVGLQVVGNTVERNNRLAFRTWEIGGIKFHFAFYSLIEGNLVRDNDAFGIWMDNTFYKCRLTRNVILNNYLAGIFPELAHGPMLIDNNVVAYTRHGDGIYSHDASGFTIAHNLIYSNANYGIWTVVATDRGRPDQPFTSSHQRVYNNLVFSNHAGAISLPFPFARAKDNISDSNLFMAGGAMDNDSTSVVFRYNSSQKRAPEKDILAALDALPAAIRPDSRLWSENPDLTLAQWRELSGNDRNSLTLRLQDDIIGLHTLEARLNFGPRGRRPGGRPVEELWQLRITPVPGVDVDFYGNPIPAEGALPGPFQNVAKAENRWLLWPVQVRGQGYPLEPGEVPQAQPTFSEAVRVAHGCTPRRPAAAKD